MSIRRQSAVAHTNPVPVGAPVDALVPLVAQSISERLGIQQSTTPPRLPAPFAPQFKEVPVVSGTVVDDLFDELDYVDVDATGLFGKGKKGKKEAAAAKVEGEKKPGFLAKAKSKADAAVRKASEGAKAAAAGAKKAAAGAANKLAGMQKFDFQIYNDDFTAVLAVAKKINGGTEADAKNNIKAFKKFKHKAVTKQAEAQEAQMLHNETLVKKVKGKEDKMVGRASAGRNAAVLGFSQVESSDESNERFASAIFDKDAPGGEGVPTIVQLNEYDTNKVEDMQPISALVLEALDTDQLETSGEENGKPAITVTMQAIKEAKIDKEVVNTRTKDQVEFDYTLCVHGLYVNEDKELMMGRKILVHQQKPADITAYGIATPNGIESALHHAMEGKEIDLLYLWECYRLVAGVHKLGDANLDKAQKAAIKELLGEGLGMATQNSFAEDFDDDEFDEVNRASIMMED